MITLTYKGDWRKTNTFLERCLNLVKLGKLDECGRRGVQALQAATPVDTGETAKSWYYKIERKSGSTSVVWLNSNQNQGIPIAILIQYGHGLQNGVYIKGTDFINPAMKAVFDEMADNLWKELIS